MAYQKSHERILKVRSILNDPKWRPPPLEVVNVSLSFLFLTCIAFLQIEVSVTHIVSVLF